MKTHLIALVAVWGLATPVWAGELDREFKGGDAKALATAPRPSPGSASELVSGTELDGESPTQAGRYGGWGYHRGWGHHGGWGHGWGHHGHWGHYGGWGHGWGYGYRGWYRPYFGLYAGWGYGSSYYYRPYYAYYQPVYAYSYYPSWGYAAYAW